MRFFNQFYFIHLLGFLGLGAETLRLALAILWLLATLFLTVITILLFRYMIHVNQKDHIGYLPSDVKNVAPLLDQIITKYIQNETAEYTLIEPGAGAANVAYHLSQRYSWKQVLAIEDELLTLLYGRVKSWFRQNSRVEFVKANIFEYDFPQKSVVYCYLLSEMIDKLYIQGKLKGNLVVSLSFPLKSVEPVESYEIPGFQKYLYVYDFR
jgi:hypothetical protein